MAAVNAGKAQYGSYHLHNYNHPSDANVECLGRKETESNKGVKINGKASER